MEGKISNLSERFKALINVKLTFFQAIMARTRGKGGAGTPTGTPKKETPGGDAKDDKDSTSQNSQPAR